MHVVDILPHLHLPRFCVGQACLWRGGDELTLIDAGPAGSRALIAALAGAPGRLRRNVLTHFHENHEDHACGAGGAGQWSRRPVTGRVAEALRRAADTHRASG